MLLSFGTCGGMHTVTSALPLMMTNVELPATELMHRVAMRSASKHPSHLCASAVTSDFPPLQPHTKSARANARSSACRADNLSAAMVGHDTNLTWTALAHEQLPIRKGLLYQRLFKPHLVCVGGEHKSNT